MQMVHLRYFPHQIQQLKIRPNRNKANKPTGIPIKNGIPNFNFIVATFTNGVGNIFIWINENLTEKLPEFI